MKKSITLLALLAAAGMTVLSITSQSSNRIIVNDNGYGIDVSHHQGKIDWNKVAADKNLQFVYIKATEGATYVDPLFEENLTGARKAKLKVGVYHYYRTTSSIKKQFENLKTVCPKDSVDLIPMLDVENCGNKNSHAIQEDVSKLSKMIEEYYGKKPMIYSVNSTYNKYLAPEFNSYKLYIGRYGKNQPIIKGTGHYTIWQYSESGKIKGISKGVDLCRFHDDASIKDILL